MKFENMTKEKLVNEIKGCQIALTFAESNVKNLRLYMIRDFKKIIDEVLDAGKIMNEFTKGENDSYVGLVDFLKPMIKKKIDNLYKITAKTGRKE